MDESEDEQEDENVEEEQAAGDDDSVWSDSDVDSVWSDSDGGVEDGDSDAGTAEDGDIEGEEEGILIVEEEEDRTADMVVDPIDYNACPSRAEQKLQFVKLMAFAVIKMIRKHNDVLLGLDVVDRDEHITLTNRIGESYHKKAGDQLRKCHNKRDILIQSELIVRENPEFTHLMRDTSDDYPTYYTERRRLARALLSNCSTAANHDHEKAEFTSAAIEGEIQEREYKRRRAEDDKPLLDFLIATRTVPPNTTKVLKKDMIQFFRAEQLLLGRHYVSISQHLDENEYRDKLQDYMDCNENNVMDRLLERVLAEEREEEIIEI